MSATSVDPELLMFRDGLLTMVDRVVACLDGLDEAAANWRPDAPDKNSLVVIAAHVLGNVEEYVFEVILGQAVHRSRDAEFATTGPAEPLIAKWTELRPRMDAAILGMDPAELARERFHPRRDMITGRRALYQATHHSAEHAGEAELTRDLRAPAASAPN